MPETVMERAIHADALEFAEKFNRVPFEVTHHLADDPLFDLDHVIDLTQRVESRQNPHRPWGDIYANIGDVEPGLKVVDGKRPSIPASELIRRIEESRAWITLEHVEREEGYRELLQRCICDLLELSGKEVMKQIKWFDAILFVTSPGRVTHYHIDRECAWLVQLRGDKEIHLFDKRDKQVVPDEELERFWNVDNGAGTYKPEYECRAMVYTMHPGTGVHIPVNCPHWLKNGTDVSISMNVNFQFHDEIWGNIFKVNHYLRRLGLHPNSPGEHPWRDNIKRHAFSTVRQLNHMRKGKQEIPEEALEDYRRIQHLLDAREHLNNMNGTVH